MKFNFPIQKVAQTTLKALMSITYSVWQIEQVRYWFAKNTPVQIFTIEDSKCITARISWMSIFPKDRKFVKL